MKSTTMEKSKKKKNPRPEEDENKKKGDSAAAPVVNDGTTAGDVPIEKQTSTEEIQPPPNPLDNPFYLMEKALERKLRNLEKRQKRLEELKAEKEVGGFMPVQQQIEAMNKIDEIRNQIEFLGEMQKLNKKQLSQYKKCAKARDRELKKQQQELARSQTTTPLQTTEEQSQKSSSLQSEKEEQQPKMMAIAEIESKLKSVEDKVQMPMPPESQPPMNTKSQVDVVDNDENKENVPMPIAAATVVMDNSWGMGGGGGW